MTNKEYYRQYYEANRERIIARVTEYRKANIADVARRQSEYHAKHREHISKRAAEYRAKNKPVLEAKRKFRKYGITSEHHQKLLTEQNGLCAICGRRPAESVDHSHTTKAIRGLLCDLCNAGLGFFGEDISVMMNAIDYLGKWATPFRSGVDEE